MINIYLKQIIYNTFKKKKKNKNKVTMNVRCFLFLCMHARRSTYIHMYVHWRRYSGGCSGLVAALLCVCSAPAKAAATFYFG